MKAIREVLQYPRPPADAFALISSGAFQLEVIAHLGGLHGEIVEERTASDGSVTLVTRQQTPVELPGFARKLIPANTTVTQTYEWGPPGPDGGRQGTWAADIKGAPVTLGGPTELRADGPGSVHVFGGHVKASVPVVGGRLESFALDNLARDLARTAEFTAARLSL